MKIALNVSGMLTVVLENKFSSFLMQFCPFIVIIDYVLDCGNMIKKILFCFIIFLSFYIQNAYAKNIYLDNEWQYASYSVINSGYSVLYEADNSNGYTVAVNAGHGTTGGSSQYVQCHPDGTPKVTGGTTAEGETKAYAVSSGMTFNDGTSEYIVTLQVANLLKEELLKNNYNVLMIRDSDDVQLDNIARTVIANNNADIHISLHFDSTESDKGIFYMSVPDITSYKNMEPVKNNWQYHNNLGNTIIKAMQNNNLKIYGNGSMAMDLVQTSYSTIPSIDLELGDKATNHDSGSLKKLAEGIKDGINDYFKISNTNSTNSNELNFNNSNIDSEIVTLLNELKKSWPSEISESRVSVIKKAASLINKGIVYPSTVGSGNTVTSTNPTKLDCSDYISWAFYNGGVTSVGDWCTGTFVGSNEFIEIAPSDLVPGDIALNSRDSQCTGSSNHIGIYVGKINNQNVYFHSSSGDISGPQVRYGNGNFTVFYRYKNWSETNYITGNNVIGGRLEDPYPKIFPTFTSSSEYNCDTIFKDNEGNDTALKVFLNNLFNLIKILTPAIVIILTIIDYAKVITSNNADAMKKTNKRTIKRIVIGLIIFFLPFILDIVFQLFGLYDIKTCGIGSG